MASTPIACRLLQMARRPWILAQADEDPIDLLLSDVIMPRLDGVTLANRLRALHPGMAALFMSGYARRVLSSRSELSPDTMYLPKPFGLPLLARTVRTALDGREN